jgi:hypothetical protein
MIKSAIQIFIFLAVVFGSSCNGKLSDEQRRRLVEGMKRNQIKKISEARITDAAFAFGQGLAAQIGTSPILTQTRKDSIERSAKVKIEILYPGEVNLTEVEKQIVEAYAGFANGQPGDNVQRFGKDSVLYTKPFMKELPDGSFHFTYALSIRISVKQIVLSIKD